MLGLLTWSRRRYNHSMRDQTKLLIFFCLAILALLVLGMGLTGLEINPGKSLSLNWKTFSMPPTVGPAPGAEVVWNIFRIIYFICWLIFPIALIYILLSPQARKDLLKRLLLLIPFIILFLVGARFLKSLLGKGEMKIGGLGLTNPPQINPGPETAFSPSPPNWIVFITSLVIALLVFSVIIFLSWFFWKRKNRKPEALARLGDEAQKSLQELASGKDLGNVIIRCYYEMSQVLGEVRGIRRMDNMTPHEFEQRLEGLGLPKEAIHQLTMLFEEVRYGKLTPGGLEEQRATASLNTILQVCRK
jgi:hypothetical protein